MYARRNDFLDTPGWRQCKRFIKNGKTLARMANQAKRRSHCNQPKYKYRVQVPRSHEEAAWIDTKDGNTKWQDSERTKINQLDEYSTFEDLGIGTKTPEGYKKIPCHMVYDVKHTGAYKSRFVVGGY